MKVLCIADASPANRWIIAAIEARHPVTAILRPDWQAERPARAQPLGPRLSPYARLLRRLRSNYFAGLDASAQRRLARDLFPAGTPDTPHRATVTVVSAWEINAPSTESWIRAQAPDLLVVSGAPILRANIYDIPRLGTINLHFGISPAYRGMHSLVTPWQRGDYTRVGATVHYVNDGIDAGPALLHVYPTIQPSDDLAAVEATVVRGVATALSGFLTWLGEHVTESPPYGRRFPETGVLIRFHDRHIHEHLRFRLGRLFGARAPHLQGRVDTFYR